jgi:hypothetical protein
MANESIVFKSASSSPCDEAKRPTTAATTDRAPASTSTTNVRLGDDTKRDHAQT